MTGLVGRHRRVDDMARYTAMQHVFESMGVGVGIAVEDGALIEVNEALLTLLGLDLEQALGRTLEALLDGDPSDDADRRDRTLTRSDGRRMWVRITARDVTGRDGRVLLRVHSVEDVTDHKALERALRERALHDPVTGLANRYLFQDRLEHALSCRDRGGQELAVLFVDLDDFKAVNDTAGHCVGDQVLREAGRRIVGSARACDTVARWAGDEFVVLCDGVPGPEDAQLVAARITEACAERFVVDDRVFSLGASVGLAMTRAAMTTDAERLIELADQAMYAEKSARR